MHSIARKVTQKIKSVTIIRIIIFQVYKKEIATYKKKKIKKKEITKQKAEQCCTWLGS